MAKKASKKKVVKKGLHHRIPEKHHDRVIVYGGIIAIALMLLVSGAL
jgi:hypothetical protein